jgi:hypothetical protein
MTKSSALTSLDHTLQHGHASVNHELIRGETEVDYQNKGDEGDLSLSMREDE